MSDKSMFDEAFPQDRQIGGSHYQHFLIQPWTFIRKNGLNPFQANVIKYVCRYLFKGKQIEDLENKVKTLSDHLSGICCQAYEDTPSEYRTEHFRSTMDDAYEYLEKIGYFKRGK